MEETKLIDICDFIVDCPHSTAKDEGVGYPLIRTPNVGKGRLVLQNVHRVSESIYNERNERAIPSEDDIILAREAPVGNVAIIRYGQKVCLGQRVVLLRPNKTIVNPMFLVYYLLSDEIQHKLKNNANGAVVAHLNMNEIRNLSVSLPKRNIQDSIASILCALDDKIELNRRINDNLEQQGQSLFDKYVMNPNRPRTQLLSNYTLINPTRTITKGKTSRCIDMSSLPTKGSFPCDWTFKDYNGGMKFQNGDTIMARITPCLENGKTAYINFLDENEVAFGSTEYIVLSAKEGFCSELLYFLARHDDFVSYAVAHMNGSSGRQRVSGSDIANYVMPEITNETLGFVSNKLHGIMEVIKNNSLESRRLASLRDTLFPRLMSGELKPSDIPL